MHDDRSVDKNLHSQIKNPRFIDPQDLPICCPQPNDPLWNAHPKVYLSLEENGQARCPYCGATYKLKEAVPHSEKA